MSKANFNFYGLIAAANRLGHEFQNAEFYREAGQDHHVKCLIGELMVVLHGAFDHGDYDFEECRQLYLDHSAAVRAERARRSAFRDEAERAYLAREPEASS